MRQKFKPLYYGLAAFAFLALGAVNYDILTDEVHGINSITHEGIQPYNASRDDVAVDQRATTNSEHKKAGLELPRRPLLRYPKGISCATGKTCNITHIRGEMDCHHTWSDRYCFHRFVQTSKGAGATALEKLDPQYRGCMAGSFCPVDPKPTGPKPEVRLCASDGACLRPVEDDDIIISVVHTYYKDWVCVRGWVVRRLWDANAWNCVLEGETASVRSMCRIRCRLKHRMP